MKRIIPLLLLVLLPTAAVAQVPDLSTLLPQGEGSASGRIIQMVALLTVLSLAPGLLIMVTSFTRFVVALSFLRTGLGLQTTPANIVMISLALFLTFYVMAPTFDRAWVNGLQPLMKNEITEQEAYSRVTDPFRDFMLQHVREKDLQTFENLAAESMSDEDAGILAAHISEDIVTYLRSASVAQFEGSRGLQHLRDDLTERASIRSSGKVRELIIETLVIQ